MRHRSLVFILTALVVAGLFSCKKKSSDNNVSNLRIKRIDVTHGLYISHYRIAYTGVSNVDSILMYGGGLDTNHHTYKKFDYIGSSFTITNELNDRFTVEANTSGQILRVLQRDTLTFLYNNGGAELGGIDVKSPTTAYPYVVTTSLVYAWSGGDITGYTYSGGSYTYEYDNGQSGQAGDSWRIDEFLTYGRSYTKTAHLPKTQNLNGTWAEKYLYQFDGNGRISEMKKIRNSPGTDPDDTVVYSYGY